MRCVASGVRRLPFARFRVAKWVADVRCRFGRRNSELVWGRVATPSGDAWLACDLRDGISREVLFNGVYEPLEAYILATVLRPGMRFVDVGANRGYFTLLAAGLVGPTGRVLALEPDPRLLEVLLLSVTKSRLPQVVTLPVAAGASSHDVALLGFDEASGNFGVSRVVAPTGDGSTFSVPARPLDEVLADQGMDEVDLLKMDIEGYEGFALAGLARGLSGHRVHRLLLELHPIALAEYGHSIQDLIATLRAHGYQGWHLDHSTQGYRAAAYSRGRLSDLVTPLTSDHIEGQWPHTFWTAPGVAWGNRATE